MVKIFLALYFLFPKINIISLPGFVTGIRMDDLCALGIVLYWLGQKKIPSITLDKLVIFYISVVTISFITSLSNLSVWEVLSYLRIIEYLVIAIAIVRFVSFQEIIKAIQIYLIINLVYCIMQWYFGFPAFASIGPVYNSSRLYGLTGGAWELGAIAAISAAYLATNDATFRKSQPSRYFLLICFSLIILASSRSQIPILPVILLSIMGFSIDQSYRNILNFRYFPYLLFFTFIAFFGINYLFFIIESLSRDEAIIMYDSGSLLGRSFELFSIENLTIFLDLARNTFITSSISDLSGGSNWYVDQGSHEGADDSFLIRAYKWMAVINILANNFYYFIFGLGPGSLGDALDGGFLRSFAEYGILIIFYYIEIVKRFLRYKSWFIIFAFFLPTMLFIDIHLSSKVQPLILALALYSGKIQKERGHEISN